MRVFMALDLSQLTLSELENLIAEAQAAIAKLQLPPLNAHEQTLLVTRPIEAIKCYRERVGCSLREAKDMIDRARAQQ